MDLRYEFDQIAKNRLQRRQWQEQDQATKDLAARSAAAKDNTWSQERADQQAALTRRGQDLAFETANKPQFHYAPITDQMGYQTGINVYRNGVLFNPSKVADAADAGRLMNGPNGPDGQQSAGVAPGSGRIMFGNGSTMSVNPSGQVQRSWDQVGTQMMPRHQAQAPTVSQSQEGPSFDQAYQMMPGHQVYQPPSASTPGSSYRTNTTGMRFNSGQAPAQYQNQNFSPPGPSVGQVDWSPTGNQMGSAPPPRRSQSPNLPFQEDTGSSFWNRFMRYVSNYQQTPYNLR